MFAKIACELLNRQADRVLRVVGLHMLSLVGIRMLQRVIWPLRGAVEEALLYCVILRAVSLPALGGGSQDSWHSSRLHSYMPDDYNRHGTGLVGNPLCCLH